MPGIRFDQLLASTAVVLSLSGIAGGALAEPKAGSTTEAIPSPASAVTLPAASGSDRSVTKSDGAAAETSQPTAAKPDASPDQPRADTTEPKASSDLPAAAPAAPAVSSVSGPPSDQPSGAPAPTAAAETPAVPSASNQPPDQSSEAPAPAVAQAPATSSASGSSSDQPSEAPAPAVAQVPAASSASGPSADQPSGAPATAQAPAADGADEAPPAVAAPAAAPPNDAAAAVAPPPVIDANAAVAEQLRELANGKFDRIVGGKKERPAIDAFYSGRNYAPLWLTDGKPNARATAAVVYLGHVDADGLDPADYPVPDFASLSDPAALAEAELRLTMSVVTYAHHAQVGRVHWSRVSGDIYYDQKPPAPADVLAAIADASDVAAALAAYEPRDPAYLALKAKLAELRAGKEEAGQNPIPNGPTLKLGMQDERVPQLRQRLGLHGEGTSYDKALVEAVKRFQDEHQIKASGTLTAATVEALNGRAPDRPIDIIIANLERWRWMPHDLGNPYVMVNLADFTLKVMHDGQELWKTRIVDGKPNMPTPIMTAEMKYITVNPTWNVPPSIVAREYMPVLQQDPTALERIGLTVSTNPDGTIHISQPPGEKNALGRLRFNFPNKFLVYQHDTPDKQLFAYERRAFSHGCMRVQDPVKYAEVLLSLVRPHDGYTEERIRKMFGDSEVDIQFPSPVPVHLTYQTAFVDEEGKLEFRDDVYGRDKALLAILKSDERKVADIPVERRESAINRELLAMPDQPFGRGFGGGNFFSRLFGAPFAVQPAPPAPPAAIPSRKHAANDGRRAAGPVAQ